MTWDDLTAEEREMLLDLSRRLAISSPWPLTPGGWLARWTDLRAAVAALYPGGDTRKIESAAWAELCRRYRNRPPV